jgi:hypothetical protein
MVAAQPIPTTHIRQPALGLKTADNIAFIDCVRVSIRAMAQANKACDQDALKLAIETYKDRRFRALRAGIQTMTLERQCSDTYHQCIRISLWAIAKANRDYNEANRQIAITGYETAYKIALEAGLTPSQINVTCSKAYYSCLTATLQAISLAVISGDHQRRGETLADWYEGDRYRMQQAGFREGIESRMRNLVIKALK